MKKRPGVIDCGIMGFHDYECTNCHSSIREEDFNTVNFCSNCGMRFIETKDEEHVKE